MQKCNIVDFILSDLVQTDKYSGLADSSKIISNIVDGWNNNIYVIPNKPIKFSYKQNKKYNIM